MSIFRKTTYMKKWLLLLIVVFTLSLNAQTKVSGITVPSQPQSVQGLVMNGIGVRVKYFMDMYVGALYLKTKSSEAAPIILADEPMVIRLQIVSSLVSSDVMKEAVTEGFEKSTGGNTAIIKAEIQKFMEAFNEPIEKGDVFEIAYVPGTGVIVYKNGTAKKTITGMSFKKALFGIWLGAKPAQEDLKKGLLGK